MWLQSIVGISVVFLALIALSLFIYFFGKVMVNGNGKKSRTNEAIRDVSNIQVAADTDDDEIIAVITAAIQAGLRKAGITPECKIVVKSFKRVEADSPVWNATGRNEVLN
ncbi:MAG TPA: OadG family protein [Clostridia bacterium]|nr:OadG family protein [Clostridia bacterium]